MALHMKYCKLNIIIFWTAVFLKVKIVLSGDNKRFTTLADALFI